MNNRKEIVELRCACCGRHFLGWQHYDRDEGFGICADSYCANAYGYHTEELGSGEDHNRDTVDR